jgi:sulfotransferase family protein
MSKEKELHFFTGDRNWEKGVDWYKANFTGKEKILGEASPSYTFYPLKKGVVKRMHSIVPNAKLIYIIRDPIERIVSHYIHRYSIGLENRPIEDTLAYSKKSLYVNISRYYMQIEQYLRYYPKTLVLIITLEDLFHCRRSTLQKAFRFLNVNEDFYLDDFDKIRHSSEEKGRKNKIGMLLKKFSETKPAKIFSTHTRMTIGRVLYRPFSEKLKRPVLSENLKKELSAYLKEDIDHLKELTGRRFKNWSI